MKNEKRLQIAAPAKEKEHRKDSEKKLVSEYLAKQPATATQVAEVLGIYRPSMCRRKRELEKRGLLWEIKKIICPVTKHRASLLTCNPELAPISPQMSLFDGKVNYRKPAEIDFTAKEGDGNE